MNEPDPRELTAADEAGYTHGNQMPDPNELTVEDEAAQAMDYAAIARDAGDIAFEVRFEGSPLDLWRVQCWRHWNNKQAKDVNWYGTREAAMARANWIMDGRGEVISITHYVRADASNYTADVEVSPQSVRIAGRTIRIVLDAEGEPYLDVSHPGVEV